MRSISLKDTTGRNINLHYLRNKEGNEIDFVLTEEDKLSHVIKCKGSDNQPDKSFRVFFEKGNLTAKSYLQLIGQKIENKEYPNGLKILNADQWLREINLN